MTPPLPPSPSSSHTYSYRIFNDHVHPQRSTLFRYGTQRLWGAIGFGVATFIGGSVSDAAGGGFGAVMAVFVGMMTISAVVSAGFAVGRGEGDNSDRGGSGGSGGSDGNGGERGGRGGAIVEGKRWGLCLAVEKGGGSINCWSRVRHAHVRAHARGAVQR